VIQLRTNYRSGEMLSLNEISMAVNAGDAGRPWPCSGNPLRALAWEPLPPANLLKAALRDAVVSHYGEVLKSASPAAALAALGKFRILCAVREGPFGTDRHQPARRGDSRGRRTHRTGQNEIRKLRGQTADGDGETITG
jgi:hypothetical protein